MDPELEGQGETVTEETQGQSGEVNPPEGTGLHPAWNDLIEILPSQLQPIVTPHLQKYDKNFQEGVQKVHSEYEPYKTFKDSGIAPEQINYGLQLLDAMENRPQEVFKAMQEFYGSKEEPQTPAPVAEGTEQTEQGQTPPIDDLVANHPVIQQMNEMVRLLAQKEVQQAQTQAQEQEDKALEDAFAAAKATHGDFDEKYVMVQMLSNEGMTVDQAVAAYKEFEQSILQKSRQPGPKILSSGGQSPSTSTPPSALDSKDRKTLVAQMLADSKSQGN